MYLVKKERKNMNCNYFAYREMTNKLFYGVALTDKHINDSIEQIWQYFVEGGARETIYALGIGLRVVEKQFHLFPELNEIISKRLVFLHGKYKGRELTIGEVVDIGLFLKDGPLWHLNVREDERAVPINLRKES